MKHRKVGMDELFYDLVFAYAISNLTGILEDAFSFGLSFLPALVYLLSFIVMINSWMYQTVYTNRYGSTGGLRSLLIYLQAAILLFLASSLRVNLKDIFVPFTLGAGCLSVLLFLEYLVSYFKEEDEQDRHLIRLFLLMTGTRAALILLGTIFPVEIGVWISISGVVLGWIMPSFFREQMKIRPIDFNHLSERLSLLVILMFGEMIISLAPWFMPGSLGIGSFLAFAMSAVLFQSYIQFYAHFQRESDRALTGVKAIYLHYPILIGLNLITASMAVLADTEIQPAVFAGILFSGLILFFCGLYGCLVYLESRYQKALRQIWLVLPIFFVCWFLSMSFRTIQTCLVLALAGSLLQLAALYWSFRHNADKSEQISLGEE